MRILYVEDNQANVFLVRRVAKMGDHEVMNYIDGEEALRKIDAINPDLILMDIQLSGAMTGLDVVRKLRSDGYKIPIIAVTAYAMVGDMEKCIAAGCDDYLAKPLPIQRLVEIFERVQRTFSTTEREAVVAKLKNETNPLTDLMARTNEAVAVPDKSKTGEKPAVVPETVAPKPAEPAVPVVASVVETPKTEAVPAPAAKVETPVETPKTEVEAVKTDAPAEAPKAEVTAAPVTDSIVEAPKVEAEKTEVPNVESAAEAKATEVETEPSLPEKIAEMPQADKTEPKTPKDVAVAVVAESRVENVKPETATTSGEEIGKRVDK